MFETFHSRLIIRGNLIALTALRIGTGRSTEPTGSDLPVLRDAMDRPYIPGSSFKGVLRSHIERLVRAVVPGCRGACIPTDEKQRCVRRGRVYDYPEEKITPETAYPLEQPVGIRDLVLKAEAAEREERKKALKENRRDYRKADEFLAEYLSLHSCLVCLTFGSPWLASHVQVKDLPVDSAVWFGQYQIRHGVAIDRDTETAAEGLLYDYEVVPADTRFQVEILVENAEPWQLGMVLLGLKAFEREEIAIGGFKSRGLGKVRLEINWDRSSYFKMKQRDAQALVDFLTKGEEVGQDPRELEAEWIEAFREKLARRAKGEE